MYIVLAVALAGDVPDPIPAVDDAIVAADAAIALQEDIMEMLEQLAVTMEPAPDVVGQESPPVAQVPSEEPSDSDSPGVSPLLVAVE